MQSHKMHVAIPSLKKIYALRESCAKCYFCQGGLKLLLTTVFQMSLQHHLQNYIPSMRLNAIEQNY